ncbi:MAG: type VI secretion system secreted protein Hcp [Paraglaciecola psychrophila]|jgi:type VI secretion system secreted protein Hcp
MAIYLKFDDIKGDVTAEGFEDHIEITSCNFGISRFITMEAGSVANREAGLPNLTSLGMTKELDSSTPLLLQKALAGAEAKTAVITFCRTGEKGAPVPVGKYTLERAVVSGYNFSGSQGGRPQESLDISFTKIECDFSQADRDNKNGANVKVGYDLETAKVI